MHINVNRASLRRAPAREEGVSSVEDVVASPRAVVSSPDAVEDVVASPRAVASSPDAVEEVVASPRAVVCSPDAVEEVVASPKAVVSSPDAVVSSPVFCPGYEKPFSLSRISMYWAKPKVMLS